MAALHALACDTRPVVAPQELAHKDHVSIVATHPGSDRPILTHVIVVGRHMSGLIVRSAGSADANNAWGLAWERIVECRKGPAPRDIIAAELTAGREVLITTAPGAASPGRRRRGHVVTVHEHTAQVADRAAGTSNWHDIRNLGVFLDPDPQTPQAPAGARSQCRPPTPGVTLATLLRRRAAAGR